MKEWKIRQAIYHKLNREYDDDLNKVDIVISKDVIKDAIRHFNEYVEDWIYPSKSYFVAICYAHWLSEEFNENFYDLLNDPDLLAGNDPYYITYDKDKNTYDSILSSIKLPIEYKGMVNEVRKYYDEEFNDPAKFRLP
jgi:hypothetical protein